jgi:hypothetical protein
MTGIAPIDLTDPEQARKVVEDAVAAYGDCAHSRVLAVPYVSPVESAVIELALAAGWEIEAPQRLSYG